MARSAPGLPAARSRPIGPSTVLLCCVEDHGPIGVVVTDRGPLRSDAAKEDIEWRPRRRWLAIATLLSAAWIATWVGVFAALGALDRLFNFAYFMLMPLLLTVVAVWGGRLRLTDAGVEYVRGLSRLSVGWSDVEAVDRRRLTYALARETTTDTGLKISMDSFVRATPRKHRRIPLSPFADDERYDVLLDRLHEHRPDLVPR